MSITTTPQKAAEFLLNNFDYFLGSMNILLAQYTCMLYRTEDMSWIVPANDNFFEAQELIGGEMFSTKGSFALSLEG